MVKVLERDDIVIVAPLQYLIRYNLSGRVNCEIMVATNFDAGELFLAVDRLMRAFDRAFPAIEPELPAAVAHAVVEKIPRPPNAFILYRQMMNPKIKLENPELHNNERCKLLHMYCGTSSNTQ